MTVQVLAITSDLFLQSRITELAKSLGANAKLVTTEEELKTMASPPKILAIFPHVRTDLKLRAEEVMIDYIVPNSGFLKTLKQVIEKEVRTT